MNYIKKLVFALPLIASTSFLAQKLDILFQNPALIIGLDLSLIIEIVIISVLIILTSLFFILFASLAQKWELIIPVSALAALSTLPFISTSPLNYFLPGGLFLSFILINLSLAYKLKTYLTFSSSILLSPTIRNLNTLITLVSAIVFYIATQSFIQTQGLKILDPFVDLGVKLAISQNLLEEIPISQNQSNPQSTPTQIPKLSKSQIEYLKQNPELLKQYGVDPSLLDQLEQGIQPTADIKQKANNQPLNVEDLIKPQLKKYIEGLVTPYIKYLPALFALIFVITIQPMASLLSLFVTPILWAIFWVLEKSKFIKFEREMREVKKMVV